MGGARKKKKNTTDHKHCVCKAPKCSSSLAQKDADTYVVGKFG